MLWEMINWGSRVYEAFDSIDPELHYVTDKKTGKKSVDVRLVPAPRRANARLHGVVRGWQRTTSGRLDRTTARK